MNVNAINPSRTLYNKVKGGFISQGASLTQWCRSEGIASQNAISCLIGTWDGPKGKALRSRLVEASGISDSSVNETDSQSSSQNVA